jgi:hypothetical protein
MGRMIIRLLLRTMLMMGHGGDDGGVTAEQNAPEDDVGAGLLVIVLEELHHLVPLLEHVQEGGAAAGHDTHLDGRLDRVERVLVPTNQEYRTAQAP